ncbi:nucleoside deaminase [Hymenobacter puniceus]|uniref:nucleoside deaminase n=1 Tax=Hymenobacter sp. BT190 TaxID=2763505 RepID=UPI0016512CEF|nr:nucleoside deaminase [Hymenobacter sp. BT190]MBC6700129.1 nucleoside deaminase [Hymenobacter sp. BT190]
MMRIPDGKYMAACYRLAELAAAAGNPAVGAVVVCQGQIVGQGQEATHSERRVTAHAELLALQDARQHLGRADLSDCRLYTTHEPCVMCAYAIRYHRIAHVVYGQSVLLLGGATSRFPVLSTLEVPTHWAPLPQVNEWKAS